MNELLRHLVFMVVILSGCTIYVNLDWGSGYYHHPILNYAHASTITTSHTSSGHHVHTQRCKPGFTHLWEFTNPVTDIGCVLLTHPSSSAMARENQNNIRFDSGIEAAYNAVHEEGKSRSAPCPSSDKNWCGGWFYGLKYNQ